MYEAEKMRGWAIGLGLALVLAGTGCGGEDQVEALERASERLAVARKAVEDAQLHVDRQAEAVDSANEKLKQAYEVLHTAEQKLADTEDEIDLRATDAVLFRLIQKRLLDDDDLEDVAISARVSKGVVTLSGTVPNEELRERAIDIARDTPGVVSVESRIEIPVGAAPPV